MRIDWTCPEDCQHECHEETIADGRCDQCEAPERPRCDSCADMMIQGVYCHETGCRNA